MNLQKAPTLSNYCLPYAAGMVIDVSGQEIIKHIGHDGQEVWFPDEDEQWKRLRLFHIREIIDVFWEYGYTLTPIEVMPNIIPSQDYTEPGRNLWPVDVAIKKFESAIAGRRGIIFTESHAVAWDGCVVHDPNGFTASLGDYTIRDCWTLGKLI